MCNVHAGQEGTIAAPAEAAQSTKNTSDLLRRWKEYATSFKDGMKAEPPPMSDAEVGLRNDKIKIDDFQDKVMTASRKVCAQPNSAAFPAMPQMLDVTPSLSIANCFGFLRSHFLLAIWPTWMCASFQKDSSSFPSEAPMARKALASIL